MNASYLFDLDLRSRSRTAKNFRNEKFLGENFFRIWNVYNTEKFRIRTYFTVEITLINHTQAE